MTKVRVNYDGWLALPAAARQKLGLSTGDQLELEVSDGVIVLRPVRAGTATMIAAEPSPVAEPEAASPTAPVPAVKRGPGRPRKSGVPIVPPTLKARGGRRKAALTG